MEQRAVRDKERTKQAARIVAAADSVHRAIEAMERAVFGQRALIEHLWIALLAGGHALVEGVPGVAKTRLVMAIAGAINGQYNKIQFTPDLLPTDLTGAVIYDRAEGRFTAHRGPLFANILHADEINRAPPKVQSALLEAMQERTVTIGDEQHPLPDLFAVFATENPIEHAGTYDLPEAQRDRFLLKLSVGYPSLADEVAVVQERALLDAPPVIDTAARLSLRRILEIQHLCRHIYIDEVVNDYIVRLVRATRDMKYENIPAVRLGLSTRAALHLARAGAARALLARRDHVLVDDIKALFPAVASHRILISYAAQAAEIDRDTLINSLLATVAVP